MAITFKQTIIHSLDLSMGQPIISKNPVVLTDESESFITKKLISVIENNSIADAEFSGQLNLYQEDSLSHKISNWNDKYFLPLAENVADTFFRYIVEYGTIPSGDLISTLYLIDGNMHLAFLKINFKEESTHYYDHENSTASIIKHRGIYEKNIVEAVVFNLEDASVQILDESKSKYLQLLFDLKPKLSVKETIKAIEKVAAKTIEEHYDNPIAAMNELKNNISESISRTSTIPVMEIIEKTFGSDETVLESCIEHAEEFGIKEAKVEVTNSSIKNKFASQKLKTDTGIEIKMPTHLFKDQDFFEMVNEADGTITLKIKHVSHVLNK